MLPNVGTWEMLIILLVVFLVFGSKRLPDVARGIGKGMREFKREMAGFTDELNKVTQLPPENPRPAPQPPADTAPATPETEPLTPNSDSETDTLTQNADNVSDNDADTVSDNDSDMTERTS
jgi:sec-independent protein translocase protein TatA